MFETLGLTLRVFRELSGRSQAEVERKAQIGKSQLSKYENGKELPKLESLGKIITALGTTPLLVFYLSSVLGRATELSGGLRAGLIEQGAATFFRSDRESRRYREVFEGFHLAMVARMGIDEEFESDQRLAWFADELAVQVEELADLVEKRIVPARKKGTGEGS